MIPKAVIIASAILLVVFVGMLFSAVWCCYWPSRRCARQQKQARGVEHGYPDDGSKESSKSSSISVKDPVPEKITQPLGVHTNDQQHPIYRHELSRFGEHTSIDPALDGILDTTANMSG